MEKYYRFAGIDLAVRIAPERMYTDDLQLTAFRVDQVVNPHLYEAAVVSSLEPPAGAELAAFPGARIYAAEGGYVRYHGAVREHPDSAYTRALHQGKQHAITLSESMVPGMISARLVMNAMDVEHLVSSAGGVILHASYIEWEGKAIVFTAPSETGKSTQAELWNRLRGTEVINGDRAAVTPEADGITAWGIPYCGTSGICNNARLPVAAIVYLSQAPKTTIQRLDGLRAFRRVWEGCSVNVWDQDDVEKCVQTVMDTVEQVPVYHLACAPDETAVEALEKMLERGVGQNG